MFYLLVLEDLLIPIVNASSDGPVCLIAYGLFFCDKNERVLPMLTSQAKSNKSLRPHWTFCDLTTCLCPKGTRFL